MSLKKNLNKAGVPEEVRDAIKKNLRKSRLDYWLKTIPYKAVAPIMAFFIARKMKWEDNDVPDRFRKWGNNIGPHGDAFNWSWYDDPTTGERYLKRDLAPLDPEVRVNNRDQPLCYWRKGNPHVREKSSIRVWLTRNPASRAAQDQGCKLAGATRLNEAGELEWDYRVWGTEGIDLQNGPGRKRVGIRVLELNGNYQVDVVKKLFWRIGIDGSLGYKLGNVKADYDCKNPNAESSVVYLWRPCLLEK